MADPTEAIRREMVAEINSTPGSREALEKEYGKGNVWDSDELRLAFEVQGFAAPFCFVRRKVDGKKGNLTFQHDPRFYFDFLASSPL